MKVHHMRYHPGSLLNLRMRVLRRGHLQCRPRTHLSVPKHAWSIQAMSLLGEAIYTMHLQRMVMTCLLHLLLLCLFLPVRRLR